MEKTALLIVDVQQALVESHPYNETEIIKNIYKLNEAARKNGIEIIYVQHDGGFEVQQ